LLRLITQINRDCDETVLFKIESCDRLDRWSPDQRLNAAPPIDAPIAISTRPGGRRRPNNMALATVSVSRSTTELDVTPRPASTLRGRAVLGKIASSVRWWPDPTFHRLATIRGVPAYINPRVSPTSPSPLISLPNPVWHALSVTNSAGSFKLPTLQTAPGPRFARENRSGRNRRWKCRRVTGPRRPSGSGDNGV
jgi:hypothetical protein